LAKILDFAVPTDVLEQQKHVRPLTVITGILLGSSVSITLSLAAVMLIFLILGDEYPRLAYEFSDLIKSTLIFVILTIISAASFYSLLKEWQSRWWLQIALWAALFATGFYYWP